MNQRKRLCFHLFVSEYHALVALRRPQGQNAYRRAIGNAHPGAFASLCEPLGEKLDRFAHRQHGDN